MSCVNILVNEPFDKSRHLRSNFESKSLQIKLGFDLKSERDFEQRRYSQCEMILC